MKKFIITLFILTLSFLFVACGNSTKPQNPDDPNIGDNNNGNDDNDNDNNTDDGDDDGDDDDDNTDDGDDNNQSSGWLPWV